MSKRDYLTPERVSELAKDPEIKGLLINVALSRVAFWDAERAFEKYVGVEFQSVGDAVEGLSACCDSRDEMIGALNDEELRTVLSSLQID